MVVALQKQTLCLLSLFNDSYVMLAQYGVYVHLYCKLQCFARMLFFFLIQSCFDHIFCFTLPNLSLRFVSLHPPSLPPSLLPPSSPFLSQTIQDDYEKLLTREINVQFLQVLAPGVVHPNRSSNKTCRCILQLALLLVTNHSLIGWALISDHCTIYIAHAFFRKMVPKSPPIFITFPDTY